MPRPNTVRHVVTEARKILGLTRPQLAERIGVSRVYVEKIERGQTPSLNVAFRIREITGVAIDQLMAGEKGRPVDGSGRPITKEFVNEANALRETIPIERVDQKVSSLAYGIEILLDAAAHAEPEKFSVVEWALWGALEDIEKEFELTSGVTRIRKGYEKAFIESGMRASRAKLRFAPNTFPVVQSWDSKDIEIKNAHRRLRYEARAAKGRAKREAK
jgi:transcriptional regulator with XRE-family HTH domain